MSRDLDKNAAAQRERDRARRADPIGHALERERERERDRRRGMHRPELTGRPWRRVRLLVLERDGWVCHLCHLPGATSVDHLVPAHLGGTDDLANLAAAHLGCNSRKGARVPLPRSRLATPTP